jgi:hypothetical protein
VCQDESPEIRKEERHGAKSHCGSRPDDQQGPGRQTDRQTDQTDRQPDQTDQTDRQTDRDTQTERERETDRDRQTDRQRHPHTDAQALLLSVYLGGEAVDKVLTRGQGMHGRHDGVGEAGKLLVARHKVRLAVQL